MKFNVYNFLIITLFSVYLFALPVSTVLNDGQGGFDPWNQTRWADWYSGGKLVKQFDIDCDVTFVDRGGSSNPWTPDVSDHETGRIFNIANSGRGVTIDGNDVCIDVRPEDYSLSQLYSNWGWYEFLGNLYGLDRCFNISQRYSSSDATIIKNLSMKGFVQAIRTGFRSDDSYHPLLITECDFSRNEWAVYFSGSKAVLQNCSIKEQLKGGIYSGARAYGNVICANEFRDNDIKEDINYGDIAMDTTYDTLIENNTHLPPLDGDYHCGIKMYRNSGESGDLREHSVHHNIIRNNNFDGYDVAYEVGSRQGRDVSYDLSDEGRDYANYNIFENNTINNTEIGIKINCSANTIRGNTFSGVTLPIVLHCVFFSLTENIINDQAGDDVSFWFVSSDYSTYSGWFPYQNDRNGSISESEKILHVRSDYGIPAFQNYTGPANLIIEKSLLISSSNRVPDLSGDQFENMQDMAILAKSWLNTDCNLSNHFCNDSDLNYTGNVDINDLSEISDSWLLSNNMKDVYASGATPIDIAVGDYWVDNPGDEIAVIWDTPVSKIDSTNYYSIIMYDSNGIEINRCGRSTTKWAAITSGNFVNLIGTYNVAEAGDEVAAVPATTVGGYYPVYVFGRGRKTPSVTLLSTNTSKIIDLVGGNFNIMLDKNDEIAVIYDGGSQNITFCKPTDTGWSSTTTNADDLIRIAAGNFDGDFSNGDEIAGINDSSSSIYFYMQGGTGSYETAASSQPSGWNNITAGDFDGYDSRDEVVVAATSASSGIYKIEYYVEGSPSPFKQSQEDVLGVPVKALSAGKPNINERISFYERSLGSFSPYSGLQVLKSSTYDTGDIMSTWGGGLGFKFTTGNTARTIHKLGFIDINNDGLETGPDGLVEEHPVLLFDWDTETLLASATVPAGTAGELIDGYRYADLAIPYTLQANHDYVIIASPAHGDSVGDRYRNVAVCTPNSYFVDTTDSINWARCHFNPWNQFPNISYVIGQAYGGPNALFGEVSDTEGDFIAVLPSQPQTTGIPIFWLQSNQHNSLQKYLKVTPVMR